MNIDRLLIEMIYQSRSLNHNPTKILLGCYVLKELKNIAGDMVNMLDGDKLEFMGIEIEESNEYKFLIGIV